MKLLIRIVLPFICAIYLSAIIGEQVSVSQKQYLLLGLLIFPIAQYLFNTFHRRFIESKKVNRTALVSGLCLAGLLLGAGGHYLVPRLQVEQDATVTITALGEKDSASSGAEIWIQAITNGASKLDLSAIPLDSGWERKDGQIVSYRNQPAKLTITVAKADRPAIKFLRHAWSGKMKLTDGKKETVVDLYKKETAAYEYSIKNSVGTPGEAVKQFFLGLLTFVFLFAIFYPLLAAFWAGSNCYYIVNLVLWAILFLMQGYLSVSSGELITLFVISFFAGRLFGNAFEEKGYGKSLGIGHFIILALISLYAAFACTGNALYVQKNNFDPGACFFFFLLFSVWFFSIAVAFLFIVHRLRGRLQAATIPVPDRPAIIQLWAISFLILTVVWLVWLFTFYPGIMSSDSVDQWGQAVGLKQLNNAHPVFHTYFNKFLLLFSQSPSSVAAGQILFMAAVTASFLSFLYVKGIPGKWLMVFAVIFALLPANGVHVITLWKDIPWTISLLWLTLLLAKIAADKSWLPSIGKKPLSVLGLILALLCVAQFRHNGILVYAFAVLALLIFAWRYKSWALAVSVALSFFCLMSFKIFVVNRKSVIPVNPALALIAPVDGLAAVLQDQNGRLAPEIEQKMLAVLPKEQWVSLYSPYSADPYQFRTNGAYLNGLSSWSTMGVMKMYISTFTHNPDLVIIDRLKGADFLWNVSKPEGVHNQNYNRSIEANDYQLEQKETHFRSVLLDYLEVSENYGQILWWRAGLYNIFILLLMFYILQNGRRRQLLPFLPWAGAICSLIPSIAWQDYRYVYFAGFLFGFLFLLTISNIIGRPPEKDVAP